MSPALVWTLFAILGSALVGVSAACWVLWRRARALSAGSDWAVSTVPPVVIGPKPKVRHEATRRVDDLASRFDGLEARLAKVEAAMVAPEIGPRRTIRRVDRGGSTLIAVPNLASPTSPSSEAAAELVRRYGEVWAMADSGASVEAVARESGYPVGQVELILGLRRQLHAGGTGLDG